MYVLLISIRHEGQVQVGNFLGHRSIELSFQTVAQSIEIDGTTGASVLRHRPSGEKEIRRTMEG